jgi:DNA/RNA endonuclease YhcR with UshA esterase domain
LSINMKKILLFTLALISMQVFAQQNINTKGTAVTQNFDGLNTTGSGSFTNNSTLPGWHAWKTNPYTAYAATMADSGTLNSGNLYSLGNAASTDRALGSLCSGSSDRVCYGWRLKNNTGSAINSLEISYYGEQWRVAGIADNRLWFNYKIDSKIDSLDYKELKYGIGMTRDSLLDFISPQKSTTAKALNGNDAANRVLIKQTISVSIPINYEIFIVWIDSNDISSDNMLAIDDVSVNAVSASDVTPPTITGSSLIGKDTITVTFSEAVKRSTAENVSNYSLNPSATISAAMLDSTKNTVSLVTSLTTGITYTLNVTNIEDLASNKMSNDSITGLTYSQFSTTLKVSSVVVVAIDTIVVELNEAVTQTSAEDNANYVFSPAATVTKVTYDATNKKATVIAKLTSGKNHELTVSNINDMGSPAKIINPSKNAGLLFNNYAGNGLVISEISYNDKTGPDDFEFVEIYNNSSATIELGGIKFGQGVTFTFGEYALAAKKAVVVAKFADTIESVFGIKPVGSFGGGLSNSGENVEILNSLNQTIDFVAFDDASPWDVTADGGGPSLQLKSFYLNPKDNDDGNNWTVDFAKFGILPTGDTLWATPGSVPVNYAKIKEVRREDTDGVNAANGSKVELRGVVYGVNMRSTGLQFTLIDETAGIGIFNNPANFGYTVKEGDSIHMIGSINQFRGLSQIEFLDTIVYISSGSTLKEPTIISQMKEENESDLVKILGYTILAPDANWVSNKNYKATNGTDTLEVRIDGDTDIDGTPLPTGVLDITGIVGQFDAANPLFEGYQLLPRYLGDIAASGSGPAPEISFESATASVSENAGVYKVIVKIANANANATNFTLSKKGGSAVANADYTATLPSNLSFSASSSSNVEFDIVIKDNFILDGSRTLELMLSSTDNGANLGVDSVFTLTITDNELPITNIGVLRNNTPEGKPTNEGNIVLVKGLVYGVDMRGGSGIQFTVIDNSGGIGVFSGAKEFGYAVKEGDEVSIQGKVEFFNGLTQLGTLDTIVYHGGGKTLKSPVIVKSVTESGESDLVKLEKVWFVSDTVTVWPSNGNVLITNGTDTIDVRIDRDVLDVAGAAAPAYDTMNITGLGGQFDATSPYTAGYQLLPRYLADVEKYMGSTGGSVNNAVLNAQVYPNPTQGKIYVNADRTIESWTLISISGNVVATGNNQSNTAVIETAGLAKGIYFIELKGNQAVTRTKVVKN